MGHMSLISEEIVKLFAHYPMEIRSVLRAHIPAAWDVYVNTVLRATREMDLTPLGGGIGAGMADTGDSGSSSSASGSGAGGLSDEDDEFPTSTMRVLRAMGEGVGGGLSLDEGAFGGHAKASLSTDGGDTGSSDQVGHSFPSAIADDGRSSRAISPRLFRPIDQTSLGHRTRTTTATTPGGSTGRLASIRATTTTFRFPKRRGGPRAGLHSLASRTASRALARASPDAPSVPTLTT